MLAVKTINPRGEVKYPVKAVNVLKAHGKSATESVFVKGYAINVTVASQAMKKRITGAKIACLDMNLQKTRMNLGVHVTIDDPEQLEAIRKRESEITLERIRKILQAGANVILTTKGIDDLCLKEFVEAGAMAVRRCRKEDLRRIAKATGATLLASLANLDGEESFEASSLGSAEEVVQSRVGDDELILVKGTKVVSSSSVVLRGANGKPVGLTNQSVADNTNRLPARRDGARPARLAERDQADARVWAGGAWRWSGRDCPFNPLGKLCDHPRIARAARHCGICTGAPDHPENASCERRKGLYRPGSQAARVP